MPSLAGLFSRKSNSRKSFNDNGNVVNDRNGNVVNGNGNGNSVSNVYPSLAASSSKLRLPFSRKKQSANASTASITTHRNPADSQSTFASPSPPRPAFLARTSTASASDSDTSIIDSRRLRPPPSKSAIFAAYAGPHVALSTRSLPDDRSSITRPETLPLQFPPPATPDTDRDIAKNTRKHSFFPWGSKSTPNTPHQTPKSVPATPHYVKKNSPDSPTEDKSFNLKAFRHVSGSINASDISVNQAMPAIGPPRPRETSITSESSQRISVAAFREAQARRSTAESPVPSFRTPSPGRNRYDPNPRSHSVPRESTNQKPGRERRSSTLAFTSDSDDESVFISADDNSDKDDLRPASVSKPKPNSHVKTNVTLNRQRTVTKRGSEFTDDADTDRLHFRATKSESGHGYAPSSSASNPLFPGRKHHDTFMSVPVPNSQSSMSLLNGKVTQTQLRDREQEREAQDPYPCSQSSLGFTSSRQRASMSVSAVLPSAAAKRASAIVGHSYSGSGVEGDFEKHLRESSNSDMQQGKNGDGVSGQDFRSNSNPPSNSPAPQQPPATQNLRHTTSSTSTSSTSDSEDDAPLALLMQPRRPGSALSHASNAARSTTSSMPNHPPTKPKPLIDINELTGVKMGMTYSQKTKPKANDVAFTGGATLISSSSSTAPDSISGSGVGDREAEASLFGGIAVTTSPMQMSPPLTSTDPPTTFVSPPASPVPEFKPLAPQKGQQGRSRSIRAPTATAGGKGRDVPISERLSRIVQSSVKGVGVASGSGSSTPSGSSSGSGSGSPGLGLYSFPAKDKDNMSKPFVPHLHLERDPSTPVTSKPNSPLKLSPPDQGLVDILGGSISLISRTGDSDSESDSDFGFNSGDTRDGMDGTVKFKGKEKGKEKEKQTSKRSPTKLRKKSPVGKGNIRAQSLSLSLAPHSPVSDLEVEHESEREPERQKERETSKEREDRIAPIPIKQRAPMPSFSVTSRPPRQSITFDSNTPATTPNSIADRTSTNTSSGADVSSSGMETGSRQRSSTKLPSLSSPSPVGGEISVTLASPMNNNRDEVGSQTPGGRRRSSTMLSGPMPVSAPTIASTSSGVNPSRPSAIRTSSKASASSKASSHTHTHATPSSPPVAASAAAALTLRDRDRAPQREMTSRPSSQIPTTGAGVPPGSKSQSQPQPSTASKPAPKPFANATANAAALFRWQSPASSTGDSSSGRAPFTPRDGSDVGSLNESAGAGGQRVRHIKRRSVSFEDSGGGGANGGKGRETSVDVNTDVEERRRERRRSEAKAAIELGNVINGHGPVVDEDDHEDDIPINQTMSGSRMSTLNPLMGMGGSSSMPFGGPQSWAGMNPSMNMNMNINAWQQQQMMQNSQMPFMAPGTDPNFMIAHQQAMMYAKQAYQMAVAQQAMAAAGDEWERGSSIGGFGGGSVYGGGPPGQSPFGMGMGMGMGTGGMGMNRGMGMGMGGMGNGWSPGSGLLPPSSRSMYGGGFSGARSEYGGGLGSGGGSGGGGGWNSSRSSYGELGNSKGVSASKLGQRTSGLHQPAPVPSVPRGGGGGGVGGSTTPSGAPRPRTTSQPANVGRGTHRPPPPSSWKASA